MMGGVQTLRKKRKAIWTEHRGKDIGGEEEQTGGDDGLTPVDCVHHLSSARATIILQNAQA